MDLCSTCKKRVYSAEQCPYQGKMYHKPCFQCTQCKVKLTLKTARSFDKMPYCQQHSPETSQPNENAEPTTNDNTINRTDETTETPHVTPSQPVYRPQRQDPPVVPRLAPVAPAPKPHTRSIINIASGDIATPSVISPVPIYRPQIQNPPVVHRSAPVSAAYAPLTNRESALVGGYDTFQAQIELAGQIFTVDPVTRKQIYEMFNEFNIIVCGSARVGKSTLINAICGRPLAQTSPGLDSCTKNVSRYVLKEECNVDGRQMVYTYNFWDTPGFESWSEADIRANVNAIVQKPKSDPLCMIYCASPGSFADTKQLKWLLDVCINDRKIFCALVVTNKWAGQREQRLAILDTYKELLAEYHKQTSDDEDGVTLFGNVGLCTMVNAKRYKDDEQGLDHVEAGIEELIEGIMMCLDDEAKVFHWCVAVMQKKQLFSDIKGKMKRYAGNIKDFLTKKFSKKSP